MSGWRKWGVDRLIVTAIGAAVIGGGGWIALNTTWIKAPRRGTPVGRMTPEEARRHPPADTRSIAAGAVEPSGWCLVEASCSFVTRETIAVVDVELRTGGGIVVVREAATTFADGDRTLISFPVLTQAQQISISGRFAMVGPADATIECRMRCFKLGRSAKLLRRVNGAWTPAIGPMPDGRRRDPVTGLYTHALAAADFRERHGELPFESTYSVSITVTPPDDQLAARKKAGVPDGPAIWLRGEAAWLLEAKDGRTHLIGKARSEVFPGRLVALVSALRTRETSRKHPPWRGEVRTGGLRITVENLLETVRRLDGEGRVIEGLHVRDR